MTLRRDRVRTPLQVVRVRALAGIGAASVGLVLVITGCGGDEKKVTLPSARPSSGGTSTSPAASPSTPEEAIRQSYTAFWANGKVALAGRFEDVRSTLEKYSTGKYLDFQVKGTQKAKGNGHRPWGPGPYVHITKVTINGNKAIVEDCLDSRQAALADENGRMIPGTRGTERQGYKADMERGGDGRWRVSGLRLHQAACSR